MTLYMLCTTICSLLCTWFTDVLTYNASLLLYRVQLFTKCPPVYNRAVCGRILQGVLMEGVALQGQFIMSNVFESTSSLANAPIGA